MFVGVGIGIAFVIEIAIADIPISLPIAIAIPGFCDISSFSETETSQVLRSSGFRLPASSF